MVFLSVFGLRSFAFQKITLGIGSFVFHYWGEGLFDCAATVGFAMVYCWICADRDISSNIVWCKLISPILPGARIL